MTAIILLVAGGSYVGLPFTNFEYIVPSNFYFVLFLQDIYTIFARDVGHGTHAGKSNNRELEHWSPKSGLMLYITAGKPNEVCGKT